MRGLLKALRARELVMKTIGQFEFPETQEDMAQWAPSMSHQAIHRTVLLVAKTRVEGSWSCYCTPVPGKNHDEERYLWKTQGAKVGAAVARAAFPLFAEIPYAK